MTTPTGQIGLSHVQAEFGGSNPISMSEYYGKSTAPASGQISLGDLRGLSNWSFSISPTTAGMQADELEDDYQAFTAAISGTLAGPIQYLWEFVGPSVGFTLYSGSSTSTLTLQFSPTHSGAYSCTLKCTVNGQQSVTVSVTGTGVYVPGNEL